MEWTTGSAASELPTVWAHPDTEDYVLQIAALSAADDWKKKTASPGGNPNEAKG